MTARKLRPSGRSGHARADGEAGERTSRYVALLRGINVGRSGRVAMEDLRAIFGDLGYSGVRTLLNSGNVVFDAHTARPAELAARICDAIADRLGVRLAVVVLTAGEIERVEAGNPLSDLAENPSRMIVAFLAEPGDLARLLPMLQTDWTPEAVALGERVAYLWCPGGVVASSLVKALGRELGGAVTSRNWTTVARIAEAMKRD